MSDSLEASMMKRIGELKAENARLKAEVERLTKAGDWMMADLIPYQQFDGFKSVKDWNAAKKGGQP